MPNEGTCTQQIVIVMLFLPLVVDCLLKKLLTKGERERGGGGVHGHPRTPLATPLDLHKQTWIGW